MFSGQNTVARTFFSRPGHISRHTGPPSSKSEEFLHSIILRPKKHLGSWNLVNPLLSMNVDECAARLQPLVDQYKPIQHQTFAIEKFRNLIVTTLSCPRDKKIFLTKEFYLSVVTRRGCLLILSLR